MRYVIGFAVAQLLSFSVYAQTSGHVFSPSDEASAIGFSIKNFGFKSEGSFKGLRGTIVWDGQNPAVDSFDVSIDAASVNTDNTTRDEHLRKDTYFDVEKYPRIRLVSEGVTVADNNGHYTFRGKLTIKGTTKEISFPFLATAAGNDFIFKGSFVINRKDFEIGGTSTLGNEVTISLTVLARRAP